MNARTDKECEKCGGCGLAYRWSSGVSARCECQRDEPHRSEKASSVMITLNVIPPRKGSIRVSYDGDGHWFVKCNYFHRGEWVYDQGLMTTAHIEKLTGKKLEAPRG